MIILQQKARNLFYSWYWNSNTTAVVAKKMMNLNFWWPSTNKITGTQHHHKLIFNSLCHIQWVLVVATKLWQGTIRVGNEWLLVITGALIARTVTQRATSCNQRWYLWLFHWIIQSWIHLICPRFFNIHPDLHRTIPVISDALIARKFNQRAMSCHNRL